MLISFYGKFLRAESGASLVEYAVALIVVTIIGGVGVTGISSDTSVLATNAGTVVSDAQTESEAVVN